MPPPRLTRFEPGDFIEATIEHLIMPQSAADYYGTNQALRAALTKHANTWRMIHREAAGNDHRIAMKTGTLVRTHPSITITTLEDKAEFTLTNGLGYVPVTFANISSAQGFTLFIDDKPLNQSIHGNDFRQTNYDAATKTWSLTFNIPIDDTMLHLVRLAK